MDVEGEFFKFSLVSINATFRPRTLDRITLLGEIQLDSVEGEPTFKVRQIEYPREKTINGNITSVQLEHSGVIDEQFLFYWDVLSSNYTDVNENDRVTARVIECEKVDENDCSWRCLEVTLLEQSLNERKTTLPTNKYTANKNGIEIDEGAVEFNDTNETKYFKMMVTNTSDKEFTVEESLLAGNKSESQLKLISPTRKASFLLKSGEVKEYKFQATSKWFGRAEEEFIVRFSGESVQPFKILRYIKIVVHDTERQHSSIGTGTNVQRNRAYTHSVLMREESIIISGTPLGSNPNFVFKRFGAWPLPSGLTDIVLATASSRTYIFDTLAALRPHLNSDLTISNYTQVFHDLLYLEELEMIHNMRKYDKKSFFTRKKEYLVLAIQNVAESRPSIVLGE